MATPIWKDTFYTVENEESVDYFIMDDSTGRVIHRGRSYPDDTGKIRIPVNRICAFYVNNDLEESFFTNYSFRNTTGKFSFYVNDRFITTYDFNPDWSYDTDHEAKGEICFPINGHYIHGYNVWVSTYEQYTPPTPPTPEKPDFTTPSIPDFGTNGGSETVCMDGNYDFKADASCDWITVSKSGNCFTITVQENKATEDRECTVCFEATNDAGTTRKCTTVRQTGNKTEPTPPTPEDDGFVLMYKQTNTQLYPYNISNAVKGIIKQVFEDGWWKVYCDDTFDGVIYGTTEVNYLGWFVNQGIKEIRTGKRVKTIGEHAFYECSSLRTLDLPSVESIGNFAIIDSYIGEPCNIYLGDKANSISNLNFFSSTAPPFSVYNIYSKTKELNGDFLSAGSYVGTQRPTVNFHVYPGSTGYEEFKESWGRNSSNVNIYYDLTD